MSATHANAIKHTKIELDCATRSPLFRLIPGNDNLLAGEDYFAKRTAIEVFKCLFKLIKTVAMLNYRF